MCGIFGVVAARDRTPTISIEQAERLRDSLAHRGPDGAGTWSKDGAILTHRRLAVIDPTPAGAQPFVSDDGRFVLVYNGEIYNNAELRTELTRAGFTFRTKSDTETLLRALEAWGAEALPKIRGMFAFALYDARERQLLLARDPLGVKPLYFRSDEREVQFASEPGTLARAPGFSPRPNMAMVSAYLTTIRTVLGNDTLFEDILALAPGQLAFFDLSDDSPRGRLLTWWSGPRAGDDESGAYLVRDALAESVRVHLRADVPTCCLLSGGLDSTITTLLAVRTHAALRTYCAGARSDGDDDLSFAREAADFLGTNHAEAVVTREEFGQRWPWMIERLGIPLSTPNEVAIHAVASRLRNDDCVVTLSGEGADELFAGYESPMRAAAEFVARRAAGEAKTGGGRFELESNAWAPPAMKELLLTPEAWQSAGRDEPLHAFYEAEFARAALESDGDEHANSVDAHLRFHRRVNLTGLLQRLDTATMLASVEGRTPYADARITALAESLPMAAKFAVVAPAMAGGGGDMTGVVRTKIALRDAFRADLPERIVERPKASFPLPFQDWVEDQAGALRTSAFAKTAFSEAVTEVVAQDPKRNWRLAWPMLNLAIWGQRWWG
ncbi:MAG: asparagine synthase (glutamine-hydrolyzing) [Phycisphaerales bacterium]